MCPQTTPASSSSCTACSGFGVWGFGFRVSGSVFSVSCFVFRVPCFGFRVSCFVFRDSGFGIRVYRRRRKRARLGTGGARGALSPRGGPVQRSGWARFGTQGVGGVGVRGLGGSTCLHGGSTSLEGSTSLLPGSIPLGGRGAERRLGLLGVDEACDAPPGHQRQPQRRRRIFTVSCRIFSVRRRRISFLFSSGGGGRCGLACFRV